MTLDRLFNNNDQLKTNTALQMKDAGIEFKMVSGVKDENRSYSFEKF